MRTATALLAPVTMLAVTCSACATTTPGVPQPAPTTVTVISTVSAVPNPPARKVFKADSVERGVVGVMRDDYKLSDVSAVECPEDQPVVVDTSFQCTVQVGARVKEVTITVKTTDGEYEVGQPRG
ncbi:DUF4333 domain-containing protein [Actinosynnema sp. CA-248983]